MREHVRLDLLAEVGLDHVDAELEQRAMLIAPEGVGLGVREIEQTRLGQLREHRAERLRIPGVAIRLAGAGVAQQPALARELVEQRVAHRDERVLPNADAEAHGFQLIDDRLRVRVALRAPLEREAGVGVLPRATVESDHLAGQAARAHLARRRQDLLGIAVVGLGEDDAEAPRRRYRRTPGERRVIGELCGAIDASEQEQVELRILGGDEVRTL